MGTDAKCVLCVLLREHRAGPRPKEQVIRLINQKHLIKQVT